MASANVCRSCSGGIEGYLLIGEPTIGRRYHQRSHKARRLIDNFLDNNQHTGQHQASASGLGLSRPCHLWHGEHGHAKFLSEHGSQPYHLPSAIGRANSPMPTALSTAVRICQFA